MKLSAMFDLNYQDFFKGLIMAVGLAVFTVVQTSFAAGVFTFDWPLIGTAAGGAFMVYLGKNFFTPTPAKIEVDTQKTVVVDAATKEVIAG